VVHPSGLKSHVFRYPYAGKRRKLTLQPGITLAAACKAVADARYELEQGRDPGIAKRQQRQTQRVAAEETFAAVTASYLRREGGKLRSVEPRRRTLNRLVLPTLGERPMSEIRRSEIIRLLDWIEEQNGPAAADSALALIRRIMNWHATRSDDFRSPIVRGMARTRAKERARTRILSDDELRAVWKAAEADGAFGALVRFLLLTAARRAEAQFMTRREIAKGEWTLPASRNKVKVEMTRPLSDAAQAVLSELPRIANGEFVFSLDGVRAISGTQQRKQRFDAQCGVSDWVVHDLRRTARSLMSRAGVNSDHAERCLGHVIGGIRGVYDRHRYHDEMLRAYEALAAQIERIVNPTPNVVAMSA
jgi:integrase-like protein/Arm domain-containing DNA-binding protein